MSSPVRAYGLHDLTAPLGAVAFRRDVHGRTFHLFTGEPGDRFDALFGWQDLNSLLSHHRLTPRQLRVVRDGKLIASDEYMVPELTRRQVPWHRLDPGALAAEARSGATLVLSEVDAFHAGVGRLAAAVEHELRERVEVTAYAAWPGTKGYGTHRDDHDVLVLQLGGRKRWRLHGRAAGPAGAALAADGTAGPAVADVVLEPGQVLYLPRGWWHSACAEEGPSLHLTLGVWRPTAADLLGWLGSVLPDDPELDVTAVRDKGPGARAGVLSRLRAALDERLADPAVLETFFAERDAAHPARTAFAFPYAAADGPVASPDPEPDLDAGVRLTATRAVIEESPHGVVLRAGGAARRFDPALRPVLSTLLTGRTVALADLAAHLDGDRAAVRRAVLDLLAAGLLTVETV
ncbi:cupin domain-containing protein [Streptomyces luteireticuli]|uniref:JmjC domain-containing protein n=1 Tax=Streptomyces luteireticuli TaxID=173858 RepID=A0ABN0YXJ0_9ACTN